jgi:hypothetical protein
MKRTDIINHLIQTNNYERYLEIGVSIGKNFKVIQASFKESVDPTYAATYKMTSDVFFANNKNRYDLIFIDGLHQRTQINRDLKNSLACLNEGGTIVVHDCNPPTEALQAENPPTSGSWYGTGWKSICDLRLSGQPLIIRTVDTDCGCAIIQRGEPIPLNFPQGRDMSFEFLDKYRTEILNLISPEEFLTIYK